MKLLPRRIVEKPWGKNDLPPPFESYSGKSIGEIWFEPPPELPSVLIKYIFTSDKLSVQVHPSDAQARALGEQDRGKEECWLILDAEPGAKLGIGFGQHLDGEALRTAALDGSIEELMDWYPVRRGDFFYIPAGTVHAIGAGISLIEIQQNSDITYRFYDYGRPRELHLEQSVAVARGEPHDPSLRRHDVLSKPGKLASGKYFRADCVIGEPAADVQNAYDGQCLVIPVDAAVSVAGEAVDVGHCALAAAAADVAFSASGTCLLVRPA
ncbi:class I mannose-6-phosphate isomerase [Novosphingobium subterraneum]|uniref:class I mannose-6-phosphate isomerase n=1 Tax=Novosphingobium subterraneum TaxID=48936 RepID=UPI003CFF2EFD